MKKSKLIHLVSLIVSTFFIGTNLTNAQSQNNESYGSANGAIEIVGVLNDTILIAESNELVMVLNFETGEFLLNLYISSLRTGNDSINKLLKKLDEVELQFKGNLGVDFIKTVDYSPQDFEVKGYLKHEPEYQYISGKGHLEFLYGDTPTGMLSISFKINLADIDIFLGIEGLEDEIQIEIMQTVTKSEK